MSLPWGLHRSDLRTRRLASVSGALGCLLALPADGMTAAAMGTNFAEIGFGFRISGTSLVVAMVPAVLMGVAGGVLPAFGATWMPITSAGAAPLALGRQSRAFDAQAGTRRSRRSDSRLAAG